MKKLLLLLSSFIYVAQVEAQIITTAIGNGHGAGTGSGGYSGDGGQATAGELFYPYDVVFDALGNLYIADYGNNCVRKVTPSGIISTVAGVDSSGVGLAGFSGDGGQATAAKLHNPEAVTVDANGNLFIADAANYRIRKINSLGIISTFAGNGTSVYSGDGGQATGAGLVPAEMIFDQNGNMYVADDGNHQRVRKIDSAGIISTIAGGGTSGLGDGGQATAAQLSIPSDLVFDAAGNLYIADFGSYLIRKVNTTGIISTVAGNGTQGYIGDGGQATAAELNTPSGLAFDAMGNLYIADWFINTIRKVNSLGIISTLAGNGSASGGYSGDGGLSTAAELNSPQGITLDTLGNLYIADQWNSVIRKITLGLAVSVNSATICAGNTTTLTANGATTYTWLPATGLSATTGSVVIANPTVTTTYTVTGTTSGATGTTTSTVIVNPIPTLSATSNSYTICAGGSVTLTASGTNTYTWAPATTLSNNTIANPVATPTATTIYTVTGTSNGCDASAITVTVTVNANPSISVNPGYSICPASSVTMCANGASTYTWTPTNYVGNCLVANATSTYTIQGTDVNGCTGIAFTNVQVVGNPTVSLSSASPICISTCAVFSTNVTPSTSGCTYLWDFGDGAGAVAGPQTPSHCYSSPLTTVVSLTVTNTVGCVGTATTGITVNPVPSLSVQSSNAMCNGMCNGSASVTASGGSGAYSFTWTPAGGVVTNTSVTSTQSNLCAGTYSCIATDVNACADTIAVTITEPPALAITYTLVQDVAPHTWDLFYTITGSTGPYTYSFNWGDASANSNGPYPSHTYSVAGTYSICATVTNANGCTSTYCQNDAVFRSGNNSTYSNMVYINVKSGTAGALAYQKMLADSVTEFDVNVACYGVLKQGNPQTLSNCINANAYNHTIWYAKGDSLYNSKAYKKIVLNNIFQGLMREDTVAKQIYFIPYCNTTETLLYDFSLTQGSTITYSFSSSNVYMANGTYTVDSVKLQHDYRNYYHKHFYLRNHGSVNNKTLEMVEGVGNVSHPLFLYYNFSTATILTPSPECTASSFNEALGCKWNNGKKVYIDSILFKMATSPPYSNYFNDSCNYCLGETGGINQYNNSENVSIYPNPAKDVLHIEFEMLNEKAELKLFDVNGRLVLTQAINGKTTIDASNLNAGVYSLSIINNEGVVNKKLIIVK
jgi:PKD repeat protein